MWSLISSLNHRLWHQASRFRDRNSSAWAASGVVPLFDPEKEVDCHGHSHDNHKAPHPNRWKFLCDPCAAVSSEDGGCPDNQCGHPVNLANREKDDDSQGIESCRQDDLKSVGQMDVFQPEHIENGQFQNTGPSAVESSV